MVAIKKPSMKAAILAKCHNCMGHYDDSGNRDCRNPKCSLYFWMPYSTLPEDREWELYSPKKAGLVLKSNATRNMTDEQRQACAERLAKARAASKLVREDGADVEDDVDDTDETDEEDDE
jgi:hypothetical protein